jgi:plastocyanin
VRSRAGAVVRSVRAGLVSITVRDRSRIHNFHLIGPGVNRRTTVAFVGTQTWTLRLRRGTYRFVCDPHATGMRGSFRVT